MLSASSPLDSGPVLYHEEQTFRQWWIWVVILGVVAIGWWGFIQQILIGRPFGDNPAPDWGVWLIWLWLGLGLPLFFLRLRLVLEVTSDHIMIRFWPLSKRAIPLDEVAHATARSYNALREYGGWGIRGWPGKNMAYNVRGNRGVELTLTDGRRVMLGSQRPDELATVIDAQRRD